MTTKDLYRQARIQSSGVVPDEWRQSLPIPVLFEGELRMVFWFAPAVVSPTEGARLAPPQYLCRLNPKDGKLEELRAVTPSFFGKSDDAKTPLGAFRLPEGMTAEQFLQNQDLLFELYDKLAPPFAAGQPADGEFKALIGDFRRLFKQLSEPPLHPYYRKVGQDYFQWLGEQWR